MSTITQEFGKYTFEDESIGVQIVIKQMYSKHYEAAAHLTVAATTPDGDRLKLFQARTPITTDAARKRIAKEIELIVRGEPRNGDAGMQGVFGINSPIVTNDWKTTVNHALESILSKYYAGSPAVNLYKDVTLGDEDDMRIMGFLAETVNMIYGQSGSGKSYCAIMAGQAIQHGVPFCGLGTIQGNVLMVDYETTMVKMNKRLRRVDAGLQVSGDPFLYKTATVPIAQMVESLQTLILEENIDFVIIDSLARACGGSITDEDGVNDMFEAIRSLDRACLIIHHTNRGDDYFGSTFIKANARNMWRLRSAQAEGQGRLSMTLEQEKENDGPARGTLGFVLEFQGDPYNPDAVLMYPEDASKMPALRDRLPLYERLKGMLTETPEGRMLIEDPVPDTSFPMAGGNLVKELGLDKPQQSTLRSYLWALKNNTGNYKKLAEYMHIDGDWLCLKGYKAPEAQENTYQLSDEMIPAYKSRTIL